MKTKISIAIAIVALLLPVPALAYMSPSEVFSGAASNRSQPPPTAREADSVVTAREKAIAAQREQSQMHAAAPEDEYIAPQATHEGCTSNECQYLLRQERLKAAAGNQSGPTIIIGGQGGGTTVYDGEGRILHSGAPLVTATGPETAVASAAGILALLGTVYYVRRSAKRSLFFLS